LNVTTSFKIEGGATVTELFAKTLPITVPLLAAGASNTQTATVTGATVNGFLSFSLTSALPDGLHVQGWISAPDTISFKLYNSTAGNIAGASYTAKATVIEAT
jgi:hypothetical protein